MATSCPGLKDLYPKSLRAAKTSSGAAVKRWLHIHMSSIYMHAMEMGENNLHSWVSVGNRWINQFK